jgi:cytochrome c-type biogenesis protein CcmH
MGAPDDLGDLGALADRLAAKLAADPDHPDGWLLLGRTYSGLQRYDESAAAFAKAIAHGATGAEVQANYGTALVAAAGGRVVPPAAAAFTAALAADPGNRVARLFQGLGHAQAGQWDLALAQWLALEKDVPPDAPLRPLLAGKIDEAARQLGLDPAKLPGRTPAP